MNSTPIFHYAFGQEVPDSKLIQNSSLRVLEKDKRRGIHLPAIRGHFILPKHTVSGTEGTLNMWVMPLQDLFPATQHKQHAVSNRYFDHFTFLSDRENVQDVEQAQFCLDFHTGWHPVFMAKFHRGWFYELIRTRRGAFASSGHFEMHRLNWYLITVIWNRIKGIFSIYANGVLVGTHDTFYPSALPSQPCGPMLYGGNPSLVYSDISFYDRVLSPDEIHHVFQKEATFINKDLQRSLEHVYEGKDLPKLNWQPDDSWQEKLSLSMKHEEDMLAFFHQGSLNGTTVQEDGVHVVTPSLKEHAELLDSNSEGDRLDQTRMYLWSRQVFEGDLYATFDFKIMGRGGLCLFMAQAAGMQGEDFLKEYPLRSTGSMSMVCWEDVRNYHWEFYRDMTDARNDLVSHACLKNPWFKPMSFQMENRRWDLDRWYKFEFLQEGNRLCGAIDGVVVMDVCDNSFDNNGPVLRQGHIAIRCMMQTNMVFRNLRVLNRADVRLCGIIEN